ncbi:MAG: porin [Alphaproteobacteria bacterium]|nr:MAG: porin [Alphaproteobacteria bacterium]
MRKIAFLSTSLLASVVSIPVAHAVDVKMYGQVNKAVVGFDDGQNTDVVFTDNDLSSTRFGLKGEQKLDNGLTASVLLEMEMQSNPSNAFTQNTASETGANASTPLSTNAAGSTTGDVGLTERHASVGLSGGFGGVVLGQTAAATDGVITQDLTGAQDVMNSDYHKMGGGINLRSTDGSLSGITINSMTFNGGTKRLDAVRYDSPVFNGLQGKFSMAQGGDVDAAALYTGKLGTFKFKGAAGIEFNNDTTFAAANAVETRYIASASILHDSGIGATAAYTTDDVRNGGGEDPEQWYTKVGYAWDKYEVAADYGVSNHYGNTVVADSELTAMGVAAQYNLGNGVSLAGLYRNFDADRTGTSLQGVDLFAANMRVKF